jgi:hypothetical protein
MFPDMFVLLSRRLVKTNARRAAVIYLVFLLSPAILCCQRSDAASSEDAQTVQLLLNRINQLEASQRQLNERVAQLEKAAATKDGRRDDPVENPVSGSSDPAASPRKASLTASALEAKQISSSDRDAQDQIEEPQRMDVSKTLLNIRGFGDFGLYGGNQTGQTTSFSIGQTNLFITSNLSERFKFLSEVVFEVRPNNDFHVVPERVLLDYSWNDHFKLSAGRYDTAIGYYNTAYHHAAWFQTATERPFIFQYEYQGGILPIHIVGLEASGQIPSGKLGLNYVFEAGNGRSSDPLVEPVQNYIDENNRKAVNVAVFARPDTVPGLQTGFSIYHDVLSSIRSPRIDETIMAAYAVLTRRRLEWLNEALMIRHAPTGQHVFVTPAFYSQVSQKFSLYRPYFRYQYVNASSGEPVFPQIGLRTGPSVGIRFEPTASVALKLQYDYTKLRRQALIDGKTCPQLSMCAPSAVGMQVAFKF